MKANGVRESHAGLNDTRESKWWFLKSICSIEWRVPPEWTGNLGMVIGWDAIVLHHVNYSMSALTDITLHSAGIQSVFCEKWRSQSHGSSSPALPLDPNWDVRRGDSSGFMHYSACADGWWYLALQLWERTVCEILYIQLKSKVAESAKCWLCYQNKRDHATCMLLFI